MVKINVFIKYAWAFPDSPYYKYLLTNPAEGINYVNAGVKEYDVLKSSSKFKKLLKLKSTVRKLLKISPFIPIPSCSKGDYDLVHAAHCLIKNKKIPYVSDIETILNYAATSSKVMNKPLVQWKIKKFLLRDNLKCIIPWTETARVGIIERFGEEFYKKIEHKVKVVFPAVPVLKRKKKKSSTFNLIFVSRYFYMKGGLYVCEVFKELKKKYDVKLFVVGDYPESFKEKYPDIDFVGFVEREKLMEDYFSIADLFVYPGFSDTFGFAFLESLSLGIPIVCVDGPSRKEIIKEGKTGYVIDRPNDLDYWAVDVSLVKKIVDKCCILIEDKKLLNSFSKSAKKEVVDGMFSISKMQKEMKAIYEEALK